MSCLRDLRVFSYLARALVLTLGLAFACESMPVDAAPLQSCAVSGECIQTPADEPREREETLFIIGAAAESLQSETAQQLPAVLPPAAVFALESLPPSGLDQDLRHIRGHEVLPDKTGPPRA